jgi:hypothetical protein
MKAWGLQIAISPRELAIRNDHGRGVRRTPVTFDERPYVRRMLTVSVESFSSGSSYQL